MECPGCGQDNDPGLRFCVACGASLTIIDEALTAGGDSLLAPGTVLKSTYEIIRLLGEGGAGAVYEGRHVDLGHAVAVKVLFSQLARVPQIRQRFAEEGRIQANLRHPNIVSVSDIVDDGGIVAIVMEYIRGDTLHTYIQRQRDHIPLSRAVQIVLKLLDGLQAAHERQIIHRDIKPGNVLLAKTAQGTVPKLCDFGIAKVASAQRRTATGTKMGTLHYMAPEQFQDARRVDRRADIYALGVTLYELLTRRLPFDTDNEYQLIRAHVEVRPPSPRGIRPDIPAELDAVVLRALEKRPEDRFESCGDLAEALLAVPGFESLRASTSVPGVPISDTPEAATSRDEPGGRRVRAQRPTATVTPSHRPSPTRGRVQTLARTRSRTATAERAKQARRRPRLFPVLLGATSAVVVALVAVWWLQTEARRAAGSANPPLGPGDPVASVPEDEGTGSAQEGTGGLAAHTPGPSDQAPSTESECDALAEEVSSIADLEGLSHEEVGGLLARLDGAEQCRELLVNPADDTFSQLYGQTQADQLLIARYLLRAFAAARPDQACHHVMLANRAYERSLTRIQQTVERGALRQIEQQSIRELGAGMFDDQAHLQTRYYQCRVELVP